MQLGWAGKTDNHVHAASGAKTKWQRCVATENCVENCVYIHIFKQNMSRVDNLKPSFKILTAPYYTRLPKTQTDHDKRKKLTKRAYLLQMCVFFFVSASSYRQKGTGREVSKPFMTSQMANFENCAMTGKL